MTTTTTTTLSAPAVGSTWAFPTSEGCSPTFAKVEAIRGVIVDTVFTIVEDGRPCRSRQSFQLRDFARYIASGTLTPAQVSL